MLSEGICLCMCLVMVSKCVSGERCNSVQRPERAGGIGRDMTEVTPVGPDSLNTESCSAVTKCSVYLDWGARCAGDKGEAKKRLSYRNFN